MSDSLFTHVFNGEENFKLSLQANEPNEQKKDRKENKAGIHRELMAKKFLWDSK